MTLAAPAKPCQYAGMSAHDTESIDRLFLELSQFTKATTGKELKLENRVAELEDLLRSAHCIAMRNGQDTNWDAFCGQLQRVGIGYVTAKVFKTPHESVA